MNVREAILAAADHIERRGDDYDYDSNNKPACGTPGCMAGWVGHFLEVPQSDDVYTTVVAPLMGQSNLSDLLDEFSRISAEINATGYTRCASGAVEVLRRYADKHFPAPKARLGIPDSVRAIFTAEQTAVV